jgi:hypothetical protein
MSGTRYHEWVDQATLTDVVTQGVVNRKTINCKGCPYPQPYSIALVHAAIAFRTLGGLLNPTVQMRLLPWGFRFYLRRTRVAEGVIIGDRRLAYMVGV